MNSSNRFDLNFDLNVKGLNEALEMIKDTGKLYSARKYVVIDTKNREIRFTKNKSEASSLVTIAKAIKGVVSSDKSSPFDPTTIQEYRQLRNNFTELQNRYNKSFNNPELSWSEKLVRQLKKAFSSYTSSKNQALDSLDKATIHVKLANVLDPTAQNLTNAIVDHLFEGKGVDTTLFDNFQKKLEQFREDYTNEVAARNKHIEATEYASTKQKELIKFIKQELKDMKLDKEIDQIINNKDFHRLLGHYLENPSADLSRDLSSSSLDELEDR